MKKVFPFCILLFALFHCREANAQPTRIWSSYYGDYTQYGSNYTPPNYLNHLVNGTIITDIKFDKKEGYVYVAGKTTDTTGITSQGSFKSHFSPAIGSAYGYIFHGANDFLAKFDTLGHQIWATYYGGNRDVYRPSIAIGKHGNIYIAGLTSSDSGIATPGSHKSVFTGSLDTQNFVDDSYLPFLVKFDSSGQLVWGTYLGQHGVHGYLTSPKAAIACDTLNGCIYIAGITKDTVGIATSGSFQDHYAYHVAGNVSYIAKFDTSGALKWGTYYGGDSGSFTSIYSLWVGGKGDLYALGRATAGDSGIVTPGANETNAPNGGGFLVKFDSSGNRSWATYIGQHLNSVYIDACALAGGLDNEGFDDIYVVGAASDPTGLEASPNAYQTTYGGGNYDMVLMKYNQNGTMSWSTLFGGNGDEPAITLMGDGAFGAGFLSVNGRGDIYLVSSTTSTQGIQHACQPLPTHHQKSIIAKWNPDGNLIWSSYADADLDAVCAGNGGNFYIGGYTTYDSLATSVSHQPTKVTNRPSGFFAKLSSECPYISIPVSQNQNQLSVGDSFDTYQWYKNGNAVSGADSNVYSVPAGDSGSYFVTVTKSCGCSYHSDTVNYQSTGIEKVAEGQWNLQLFPNPTTGKVTFRFDLKQPETVFVSVYDLVGRQLLKKVYGTLSGQQEKKLDVSNLQPGLYFVKFAIGNRQVIRKLEVE